VPDGDRTSAAWLRQLIANNCTFPTFGPPLSCSATTVSTPALRILQLKSADGSYYIPSAGNFPRPASFSIPAVFEEDQTVINGDWAINSKNALATRFFYSHAPRQTPLVQLIGGGLPGVSQDAYYANTNAVLRLTTLVTNTFVNEARVSFQ